MSNQQIRVLFNAARTGNYKLLQSILEKDDIDVNVRDSYRGTMLHRACSGNEEFSSSCLQVIELLLARGAEVNSTDESECTPLHSVCGACTEGHVNIMKLLINNNADVNKKNTYGQTPLFISCSNGQVDAVQYLIDNNAEINIKDNEGETPIYSACRNGSTDVVKLLLDHNANVHSQDINGDTPLLAHVSAIGRNAGNVAILRLLINANANVNIQTTHGNTPLHFASNRGILGSVQLLLQYGAIADVNIQNEDGYTPLHFASRRGYLRIVKLLLRNGADLSIKTSNNDGYTAKDLAHYNDEIVSFFNHFIEMRQKAFVWSKRRRLQRKRKHINV